MIRTAPGRAKAPGTPVDHPDRRLKMAVEIRQARAEMKAWGFSEGDVDAEVARIRARYVENDR